MHCSLPLLPARAVPGATALQPIAADRADALGVQVGTGLVSDHDDEGEDQQDHVLPELRLAMVSSPAQ